MAPCAACRRAIGEQRRAHAEVSPPAGVGRCLAPFRYDGAMRGLLLALKYRNRREALAWLADELAPAVVALATDSGGSSAPPSVAVAWAPTSGSRRRQRGFDHAELLARAVGRRAGLPVVGVLRRRPGPPQTGRGAADRRGGPSFVVPRPPRVARVVLIDDVATTGGTLAAAASALAVAGVADVGAVVVAWTPPVPGGE